MVFLGGKDDNLVLLVFFLRDLFLIKFWRFR